MKISQLIIPFLSLTVLLFSCKKDDSTVTPTPVEEPPKVSIIAPAAGTIVMAGDSVTIVSKISSENLHEYGIRISSDTAIYLEQETHAHLDSVLYVVGWRTPSTIQMKDVKIEIEATDHDNRLTSAEVNIHVH